MAKAKKKPLPAKAVRPAHKGKATKAEERADKIRQIHRKILAENAALAKS